MSRNDLETLSRRLARESSALRFGPPVAHVYNPLDYAWEPHRAYLKYERTGIEAVMVGMNPGPWGMVQTGVPFGDVEMVRDWLGITGAVGTPERVHPRRPVDGFDCRRKEISGRRVWGWARQRFVTPERFFRRFFILNYCPLCFFDADGRNVTPDRIPVAQRRPLLSVCDLFLEKALRRLRPRHVFGIGRFAESRLRSIEVPVSTDIGGLPHPSPASPLANRGWSSAVEGILSAHGVELN